MEYADPQLEATEDVGFPVVECLFTRASDSTTVSLYVRTVDGNWLMLNNPSPELAAVIQRGVSDPNTQVRAYRVGNEVGVIVRCFQPS